MGNVTLIFENSASIVEGWKILEEYSGSDRQHIAFRIATTISVVLTNTIKGRYKLNVSRMDPDVFSMRFDEGSTGLYQENVPELDKVAKF